MTEAYLELTFRRGKVLAAYVYLPRPEGVCSSRSEKIHPGLVVDFAPDGSPMGIEITAPGQVTPEKVNEILNQLGMAALEPEELEPLKAA